MPQKKFLVKWNENWDKKGGNKLTIFPTAIEMALKRFYEDEYRKDVTLEVSELPEPKEEHYTCDTDTRPSTAQVPEELFQYSGSAPKINLNDTINKINEILRYLKAKEGE